MEIIQLSGIISAMSYSKDGGMRVSMHTQEMTNEEKNKLQEYFQKFGYLLFKPNEFQQTDIPKENVEDKAKTPSKRLRATLYLLWQQTKSNEDFEIFYRAHMEKLINFIKNKLD